MFQLLYKTYMPGLLIIIFSWYILFSSPECYAQVLYKISDKIGGSSGSTGQSQDNNGNSSTLIIIGAAVIVGVLVYKMVLSKDDTKKNEKKDSTSKQSLLIKQINNNACGIAGSELENLKQLPINFYFGLQRSEALIAERKFILGLSYNF